MDSIKEIEKKIIIIGGVPCIGKSRVAKSLAKKLDVNYISTDTIRSILRTISNKKEYHSLHFFINQKAELYLPNTSIKTIIEDYINESKTVWLGVKDIVKRNGDDDIKIIEGVANLPVLCKESRLKNIIPIFLYFNKEDIIKKNLFNRGLWGKSKKLKEYELNYLVEFNNYIINSAKKYNYRLVNVCPYKNLQKRILDIIK